MTAPPCARRPAPDRQIHVGGVAVGGDAPVSVQSMTTTKTADVGATLAQIYSLAAAGCDIVRCTCNESAAEGLAQIVPQAPVPIVADIHFQYKLALAAMEAGVEGLRLQPRQHPQGGPDQGGGARGQGPRHSVRISVTARDRSTPTSPGATAAPPRGAGRLRAAPSSLFAESTST